MDARPPSSSDNENPPTPILPPKPTSFFENRISKFADAMPWPPISTYAALADCDCDLK